MGLPATRIDDPDVVHCSQPIRAQGTASVIVNGRLWSCMGHLNAPHKKFLGTGCINHTAPIAKGSKNVIVEGRPAGKIDLPIAGCTFTCKGSPNVLIGG